ncbi:MAG TPA: DNA mismatch repair protein MutS [Thermodesulfobacteriota bacterium]
MAPPLTPMLRQYRAMKAQAGDALLLFHLGDFYECFFEDAVTVARALDLTLTARNKSAEEPVPMCGVPVRAADGYIARLVERGFKVAVCEQVQDPAEAAGLVDRAITRIVTPGVVTDPANLDARANNYLVALCLQSPRPGHDARRVAGPLADGGAAAVGLAALDASTGEFVACEVAAGRDLADELSRLAPREILVPAPLAASGLPDEVAQGAAEGRWRIEPRAAESFAVPGAVARLEALLGVSGVEGLGLGGRPLATGACGALLAYVEETQRVAPRHIGAPRPYAPGGTMALDEATRRSLEVLAPASGGDQGGRGRGAGSLLALLDLSVTAMGGRRIRRWLTYPLTRLADLAPRQALVAAAVAAGPARARLRSALDRVADVERLTAKAALRQANARDLAALGRSLAALPAVADAASAIAPELAARLDPLDDVAARLAATLVEDPPAGLKEGGMIRPGVHAELDELRSLREEGTGFIAKLEARERQRTGIASLKVGYNRVFGYYIEVTRPNLHLVPDDYERRQTLTQAERFVTPELKAYEEKVLSAEARILDLEYELFTELRDAVAAEARRIAAAADVVAELDAAAAFAEAAARYDYVRPELTEGTEIVIEEGRHPVIERMPLGERFVPNDVRLDTSANQILVVTGPNMAGKSTYLRQVALIVLMAQVGAFVPARSARIGLVDRIFSRIGAADDLSRGRSTFMVEMSETAAILRSATPRSLVILDELGRGTSTYDGLSLAWAVAEHLHDDPGLGCKTLFATHYHELTDLARTKPRVVNLTVAVTESDGRIVFLRKIVPGAASRSYGIQVARLAGVPEPVLARAQEVLANLEGDEFTESGQPRFARRGARRQAPAPQLALFGRDRAS